ncbi:MAG: 4-alpha-glucanotransferase [bacterium]|nr:4-alpha-glucanotransferase [bacterium]
MSGIHPLFQARSAGALLHVTSLPGRHGIGDLGPEAVRFLDWLERAGMSWWQMLPVGPIGPGDSPYSSPSSFAGEPLLISLERLADSDLLDARELRAPQTLSGGRVDYAAVRRFKLPLLARAHARFLGRGGDKSAAYVAFVRDNRNWLEDWVDYDGGGDLARYLQFEFARQWGALRSAAERRGIRLLGDLPIFVSADSADVSAHPELFRLDARGRPRVVTGVPPDAFSDDGQLWGHPHYDWNAHKRTRFGWWGARVAAQLERFDAIRVDHFIGFHRAWEVSGRAHTARRGRWRVAPGAALLRSLRRRLGALPFVAEDLGVVTEDVRALRDTFHLPGMRVLQFGYGQGAHDRPHNLPRHCVAYTGTHDNDTALGWARKLDKDSRRRVLAYTGGSVKTIGFDLVRATFASPAGTAIAPIQDLLGLDGKARMNRPGTATGNWRWRVERNALGATLARRVRDLCEATERLA